MTTDTIALPTAADVDRLAGEVQRLGQEPEPLPEEPGGVLVRDASGNPVALVPEPAERARASAASA